MNSKISELNGHLNPEQAQALTQFEVVPTVTLLACLLGKSIYPMEVVSVGMDGPVLNAVIGIAIDSFNSRVMFYRIGVDGQVDTSLLYQGQISGYNVCCEELLLASV